MSEEKDPDSENNSEEDIVIKFTSSQKERWGERVKKVVFDSTEEYVDGSFTGNVNPEIMELVQSNIVTDEVLSIEDYEIRMEKCHRSLIEWINDRTTGVHILFIMTFVEHFMQVIFSEVFSVTNTDMPDNYEDNSFYA